MNNLVLKTNINNQEIAVNEYFYDNNFYLNKRTSIDLFFLLIHGGWENRPISFTTNYNNETLNFKDIKSIKRKESSYLSNYDKFSDHPHTFDFFILNNSKKEFIDLASYKSNFKIDRHLISNPIFFLCSDIHSKNIDNFINTRLPKTGYWNGDCLEIVFKYIEVPKTYKDISSEISYCVTEEAQYEQDNKFQQKILNSQVLTDRLKLTSEPEDFLISIFDANTSIGSIYQALLNNQESLLTFKKVNGEITTKTATLIPNPARSSLNIEKKYVWFFDLEQDILKKFCASNFISLEGVK